MNLQASSTAVQLQAKIATQSPRDALEAILAAQESRTISDKEAVVLTTPKLLNGVLFSSLATSSITDLNIIRKHDLGVPGAATGKVALSIKEADKYIESGESFILVLPDTRPEHIRYIEEAAGVITYEGGMTSHASIITRQKGKPAIIGTGDLSLKNGEVVSIDGSSGMVVRGEVPIVKPDPNNKALARILEIADGLQSDKTHKIKVKANADTPEDAAKARKLGAQGIGVVRTEHMFFAQDRLPHMQAMIMAENEASRRKALEKLFPMQKEDFKGILKAMQGLPVAIRLLDAPLHEFMPHEDEDVAALADKLGKSYAHIANRAEALNESNPMLGNRAVRLGIVHPEIYEMQIKAILQAAVELQKEGVDAQPQIMIPLIHDANEVTVCKKQIDIIVADIEKTEGVKPHFKVGVMTELPGACLTAGEISKDVDFFSFGTNDLTQTTLGISRDDTADVITKYQQLGIYKADPFQTIHPAVGRLMTMAVAEGKQANAQLEAGVCGEHGGDPESIHFCQRMGIDSVSVSPPRIPVARLVAAQTMIEHELQQGWATGLGERTGRTNHF